MNILFFYYKFSKHKCQFTMKISEMHIDYFISYPNILIACLWQGALRKVQSWDSPSGSDAVLFRLLIVGKPSIAPYPSVSFSLCLFVSSLFYICSGPCGLSVFPHAVSHPSLIKERENITVSWQTQLIGKWQQFLLLMCCGFFDTMVNN